MKAHEMGFVTVWIGGTMPRDKFEAASQLKAERKTSVVSFDAPAIDVPNKMDYVATYTF